MKIQNVEKITDCRHLNLYKILYINQNGIEKSWHIASRDDKPKCVTEQFDRPDAVVIVPFHNEKDKHPPVNRFPSGTSNRAAPVPGCLDQGNLSCNTP